MLYEFEGPEGHIIEIDYPIGEAPGLGQTVDVDGTRYRRILSSVQVDCLEVAGPKSSLPRWHPDAKAFSRDGRPIMRSREEAKDWARRANVRAGYDKWQWGQA